MSKQLRNDTPQNAFNQRDNSDYLYQATDITLIQREVMKAYFPSFTVHEPIGDNNSIDRTLEQLVHSTQRGKPGLCIYNIGNWHWVVFAILKDDDKTTIFYKDSRGYFNNNDLNNKIKEICNKEGISQAVFVVNKMGEQQGDVNCGIYALKNMEIIAQKLNDNDFLSNFENYDQFCNVVEAEELRKGQYAESYVLSTYNCMLEEMIKAEKLCIIRGNYQEECEKIAKILLDSNDPEGYPKFKIKVLGVLESITTTNLIDTLTLEVATDPSEKTQNAVKYYFKISAPKDLNEARLDGLKNTIQNNCFENNYHFSWEDSIIKIIPNDGKDIALNDIQTFIQPNMRLKALYENLSANNNSQALKIQSILNEAEYSYIRLSQEENFSTENDEGRKITLNNKPAQSLKTRLTYTGFGGEEGFSTDQEENFSAEDVEDITIIFNNFNKPSSYLVVQSDSTPGPCMPDLKLSFHALINKIIEQRQNTNIDDSIIENFIDQTVLFNDSIKITNVDNQLDREHYKNIIVIGNTGAGKSSLINCLIGNTLIAENQDAGSLKTVTKLSLKEGSIGPEIGNGVVSTTYTVKFWSDDKNATNYWDCPGFADNRGGGQQIDNMLLVKLLIEYLKGKEIGFLFVVHDNIVDSANLFGAFKNEIDSIIKFFGSIESISELASSISLVVTQGFVWEYQEILTDKGKMKVQALQSPGEGHYISTFKKILATFQETSNFVHNASYSQHKLILELLTDGKIKVCSFPKIFENGEIYPEFGDQIVKVVKNLKIVAYDNTTTIQAFVDDKIINAIIPIGNLLNNYASKLINKFINANTQAIEEKSANATNTRELRNEVKNIANKFKIVSNDGSFAASNKPLSTNDNILTSTSQNKLIYFGKRREFTKCIEGIGVKADAEKFSKIIKSLAFFNKINSNVEIQFTEWITRLNKTAEHYEKFISNPQYNIKEGVLEILSPIIGSTEVQRLIENNKVGLKHVKCLSYLFIVDGHIRASSIDLSISADKWSIAKNVKFDLSGKSGELYSFDEAKGRDGRDGEKGGNFYGYGKFVSNPNNSFDSFLKINVKGGKGGDGEIGADGSFSTEFYEKTIAQFKKDKELQQKINKLLPSVEGSLNAQKKTEKSCSENLKLIEKELENNWNALEQQLSENAKIAVENDKEKLEVELSKIKENIFSLNNCKELVRRKSEFEDLCKNISKDGPKLISNSQEGIYDEKFKIFGQELTTQTFKKLLARDIDAELAQVKEDLENAKVKIKNFTKACTELSDAKTKLATYENEFDEKHKCIILEIKEEEKLKLLAILNTYKENKQAKVKAEEKFYNVAAKKDAQIGTIPKEREKEFSGRLLSIAEHNDPNLIIKKQEKTIQGFEEKLRNSKEARGLIESKHINLATLLKENSRLIAEIGTLDDSNKGDALKNEMKDNISSLYDMWKKEESWFKIFYGPSDKQKVDDAKELVKELKEEGAELDSNIKALEEKLKYARINLDELKAQNETLSKINNKLSESERNYIEAKSKIQKKTTGAEEILELISKYEEVIKAEIKLKECVAAEASAGSKLLLSEQYVVSRVEQGFQDKEGIEKVAHVIKEVCWFNTQFEEKYMVAGTKGIKGGNAGRGGVDGCISLDLPGNKQDNKDLKTKNIDGNAGEGGKNSYVLEGTYLNEYSFALVKNIREINASNDEKNLVPDIVYSTSKELVKHSVVKIGVESAILLAKQGTVAAAVTILSDGLWAERFFYFKSCVALL